MKTRKRILKGIVVSDKMKKTRVVLVNSFTKHPLYARQLIKRKRYKVHDPEEKSKLGDYVKIIESRPYSKEKHFKILEIIK